MSVIYDILSYSLFWYIDCMKWGVSVKAYRTKVSTIN